MKYGMDEATELPPKPGKLILQYHIKGSAKKISEEAALLEAGLELLQNHLYFEGEHNVDVTTEGDVITVRGDQSLHNLVNNGKLSVYSVGKDNKIRNVHVRCNNDNADINLELTIEGTKYSLNPL